MRVLKKVIMVLTTGRDVTNSSRRWPLRPPALRDPRTPQMFALWFALTLAVILAAAAAVGLFLGLVQLLDLPLPPRDDATKKNLIEVVKVSLGLAAGIGAVVALVVATRRQRVTEVESHRADQRLFTERFSTAAEQLGHDKPAVRLAGVYAMARLADDWNEQCQTCIDVLCAYLRMPYTPALPGERGLTDPPPGFRRAGSRGWYGTPATSLTGQASPDPTPQ
jgi:hypothetical protein